MNTAAAIVPFHAVPFTALEQLRRGKEVLRAEAAAVALQADRLDGAFCDAIALLNATTGGIAVTGMGKAGLIGNKIAATLSSLGIPAFPLHPADALHGDLGRLRPGDCLLALSHSGETEELTRLLPAVKRLNVPIVAITASESNTLGRAADVTLPIGRLTEAGNFGLPPTTSTTVMLALGDALCVVLAARRGFSPEHFATFHPAGNLGLRLARVQEMMRTGNAVRITPVNQTVRQMLASAARPGRRTGAVMLTRDDGTLAGLFTDSDLARLLERREEAKLDGPTADVMTHNPITVRPDMTLEEVVDLLSIRKVSELPVVNEAGEPIGLIDITDVLPLLPDDRD